MEGDENLWKRRVLKSGWQFTYSGKDDANAYITINTDVTATGTKGLGEALLEISEMGYEYFAWEVEMRHSVVTDCYIKLRFLKNIHNMKHERFYEATDRLVRAFITDDLVHGECARCAVGNMFAQWAGWARPVLQSLPIPVYYANPQVPDQTDAIINLMSGGYSAKELKRIEELFEFRDERQPKLNEYGDTPLGNYMANKYMDKRLEEDEDGFKGLCRVFDELVRLEDWRGEEQEINLVKMLQHE